MEKCTETQLKKRFPNVGSLRAALFDLWRTSQFTPPAKDDATILDGVLADPDSIDDWRILVSHIEGIDGDQKGTLLKALNADLLVKLSTVDDVLFARTMNQVCRLG